MRLPPDDKASDRKFRAPHLSRGENDAADYTTLCLPIAQRARLTTSPAAVNDSARSGGVDNGHECPVVTIGPEWPTEQTVPCIRCVGRDVR